MARDTNSFLRLLEEQNARIAARKAKEEEEEQARGEDQVRIQKDQERRERLGQLRAREHPSKRPRRAFGSVFNPGSTGE